MDTHELAWSAGLFDGEGCFTSNTPKGAVLSPSVRIHVGQNDPTVLYRMKTALGYGQVYGPYKAGVNKSDYYKFSIVDFEHAQAALAMLWPWLSAPKRAQATTVFMKYKAYNEKRFAERDALLLKCSRCGSAKSEKVAIRVGSYFGRNRQCMVCKTRADKRRRESRRVRMPDASATVVTTEVN